MESTQKNGENTTTNYIRSEKCTINGIKHFYASLPSKAKRPQSALFKSTVYYAYASMMINEKVDNVI